METGCGVLLRDECDNRAFSLNPPSSALAYAYQANKYPINSIQPPIRISSCLAQRHGLFHLIYKLKHTHQVNNKMLMKDLTCRPILRYIYDASIGIKIASVCYTCDKLFYTSNQSKLNKSNIMIWSGNQVVYPCRRDMHSWLLVQLHK
jgi:hypothetical protein